MQIGMVGLGRMGANMVRRLINDGHACVVYDINQNNVTALVEEGATGVTSLKELTEALTIPRVVWVMVPAGASTDEAVSEIGECLIRGDIVIDGGNSYFKDDVRRWRELHSKGIYNIDVGTSGGILGPERGYCLMIGGETEPVQRLDPIFRSLAPGEDSIDSTQGQEAIGGTAKHGYLHCGTVGAGHFVKMIHNGIEYGLMQAYAEGFDIMANATGDGLRSEQQYDLNLGEIAEVWRRGSIISSCLLDLTAQALIEHPGLEPYTGFVQDSGECRWAVQTAIEEGVPVNVLSASLYARFRSRKVHTFGEKLLSAMRNKFGGHVERPAGG